MIGILLHLWQGMEESHEIAHASQTSVFKGIQCTKNNHKTHENSQTQGRAIKISKKGGHVIPPFPARDEVESQSNFNLTSKSRLIF